MRYTKPNVLAAVDASAAIQNGTGATATGGMKASTIHLDFVPQNPQVRHSTSGAYEADE